MSKKYVAVLRFGPLQDEMDIECPRPTIEMIVPKKSLAIFDKGNMRHEDCRIYNYVRLVFIRQDMGHEVGNKVWINYDLWTIREEM